MKEYDINKLPKWAKQEIETLRNNVESWKRKAHEIKGDKKTNVYISNFMSDPIPLPNDSSIIFVVNPDRSLKTQQIQVKVVDDMIEVYGCEQLNIKCSASNMCYIKSRR